MVTVTREVLDHLISGLGVSAVASLRQAMKDDLGGPLFEIEGDDSGLLIGRRGETLRALQFIVKFIVSKRLETNANLMVDVEGYQERRYQALANLAERVAQRVVSSGGSITLEPMPPNERRAIHMALAEHPTVTTESTGEGERRHVIVQLR